MEPITDLISAFMGMTMSHMIALVALSALGFAAFALYVVFVVVKERNR